MKRTLFSLLVIACFVLSACHANEIQKGSDLDRSTLSEESDPDTTPSLLPPVEAADDPPTMLEEEFTYHAQTFEELLDEFGSDGYVTCSAVPELPTNLSLLEDWIELYRAGRPAQVAVLYDGLGFPSGFYILKSDGSPQYTITSFRSPRPDEELEAPTQKTGIMVVSRAFDYVFETGIREEFKHTLVVNRIERPQADLLYNPETSAALGETSPETAIQIAETKENFFREYVSVCGGYYGGGIRFWDKTQEGNGVPEKRLVVTGAMSIAGHPFYIIEHEEYSGTSYAVNADGGNLFMTIGLADFWTLLDDSDEEIIVPN